jgi:hypothetical protein
MTDTRSTSIAVALSQAEKALRPLSGKPPDTTFTLTVAELICVDNAVRRVSEAMKYYPRPGAAPHR